MLASTTSVLWSRGIRFVRSDRSALSLFSSLSYSSGDYGHGILQLTVQAKFPDIKYLQIVLNLSSSTQVASSGPGSPGNETNVFGSATENAVEEFQTIYGLTDPSGFVGTSTLAQLNLILASDTPASIPSGWQFVNQLHYMEEGSNGFDHRTFENGLGITPCRKIFLSQQRHLLVSRISILLGDD
jgi:peptidoglycan hydrolase-like protein with peptidoglycan-binding domain